MKFILYKIFTLFLIGVILSGCVTKTLWADKHEYKDVVLSFNIEADDLIVVGEKYHYFFKIDTKLKKLLLSKKREGISFSAKTFDVYKDNSVQGTVNLVYENYAYDYLNSLGFEKSQNRETIRIELKGTRYLPKPDFQFNNKFSKEHTIKFCENWSEYDKSTQILLSPLSVTADGVLTVVGVAEAAVFIALLIPTYLISTIVKDVSKGFN